MGFYLNSVLPYKRYKKMSATSYFVDKTNILRDLFDCIEEKTQYICITRPRRFGKTIMANMIGAFLGKGWDSADVFDNLYISDESRYRKYLNHYNVIYIDFSRLPENCTSYQPYIRRISEGLKHDLLSAFPDIATTSKIAVWDLLAIISAKYDTQFVFVMDEWDAVFHLPFITDGEKEEYILFLKSLLKDQEYVALAYITGILPIAKYSSGSELNMFMEFKMTSMAMFGEYFGFTDEEVDVLYEKYLHLCKDPQVSRESLRSEKSLGYVYRLASISDQMLKATLSGDADRMAEILQLAHNTETPILSYNNETELAAVVNLVYLSARDRYRVEREDKAGKGFVDFIFYPVIFDGQTPPGQRQTFGVGEKAKDYLIDFNGNYLSFAVDGKPHTFAKAVFKPTGDLAKYVTANDYEIVYVDNTYGKSEETGWDSELGRGVAHIAVIGKGNFAGTQKVTDSTGAVYNTVKDADFRFYIDKYEIRKQHVTIADGEYAAGQPVRPNVTVTVGGKTLVENQDYKLTYSAISDITNGKTIGTPVITNVSITGNKATVVLGGESANAAGYDYVISADRDCITNKNYGAVTKNQVKTTGSFEYVQQGTYYAGLHAFNRTSDDGKKVFSRWSNVKAVRVK